MRTALITGLAVAGLLTASIATPAAAVMPAYIKYDGVEGETAPRPKPDARAARPAKPERSKPERLTSRPNIAVGDISGDGRTDSRTAGRRDVKPPSPKPTGLLLPAIQKGR